MTVAEVGLLAVVGLAATGAAIAGVFSGEALAGVYGAIIGYGGKAVKTRAE